MPSPMRPWPHHSPLVCPSHGVDAVISRRRTAKYLKMKADKAARFEARLNAEAERRRIAAAPPPPVCDVLGEMPEFDAYFHDENLPPDLRSPPPPKPPKPKKRQRIVTARTARHPARPIRRQVEVFCQTRGLNTLEVRSQLPGGSDYIALPSPPSRGGRLKSLHLQDPKSTGFEWRAAVTRQSLPEDWFPDVRRDVPSGWSARRDVATGARTVPPTLNVRDISQQPKVRRGPPPWQRAHTSQQFMPTATDFSDRMWEDAVQGRLTEKELISRTISRAGAAGQRLGLNDGLSPVLGYPAGGGGGAIGRTAWL